MTGRLVRHGWLWTGACLLSFLTLLTTGCGTVAELYLPTTSVVNLPDEDLAGPCTYAIRLAEGPVPAPNLPPEQIPQTAVLVVFERLDSIKLFNDKSVIAEAQNRHMAMLYAYQCDAASFDDLQPNANAGPGRALFQALNQFAASLNHPELASANVFLTGASAAGYLSISTAAEFPGRVLGTIPYAPASAIYDIGSFNVTPALAKIPSLILVNGTDIAAGDERPLFLFQNGWAQGAPWGFGAQQHLNHCCVDSIAPLLIPWVDGIFTGYTTAAASGLVFAKPVTTPVTPQIAFQITPDGSFDPFGYQDFYFGAASISTTPVSGEPFQAWVPDQQTATAWLTWVNNPDGN